MRFIPYYRVSTKKQGKSGLGLEAQRSVIEKYISSVKGEVLAEFTEVESGKSRTRVELLKAVDLSAKEKAILIVAKLDRLSRDAEFSLAISNKAFEIVCCDFPSGNKMVFGILSVIAEYERTLISNRTKAAWDSKKARGYVHPPGSFTDEIRKASADARRNKAINNDRYKQAKAMVQMMKDKPLREIAERLNELNYRTATGKEFKAESVRRMLL